MTERLADAASPSADRAADVRGVLDGWFDAWGAAPPHARRRRPPTTSTSCSKRGASVNIYMFHGGTNFGFTNGANDKGTYRPIITSYDYDAPLNEAGHPTAKYWAYRDVLSRYTTIGDQTPISGSPVPTVRASFRQHLPLWHLTDRLGAWSSHETPPTADEIGHYDGFTLYRTGVAVHGRACCPSTRSVTVHRSSWTGEILVFSPAIIGTVR